MTDIKDLNGGVAKANPADADYCVIQQPDGLTLPTTIGNLLAGVRSSVTALSGQLNSYIPLSQKGAANGVASLGSDGKVPAEQLPSGGSSGGGSSPAWQVITANYSATAGDRLVIVPNSSGLTLTLPSSAANGAQIEYQRIGRNPLAVSASGVTTPGRDWDLLTGHNDKWYSRSRSTYVDADPYWPDVQLQLDLVSSTSPIDRSPYARSVSQSGTRYTSSNAAYAMTGDFTLEQIITTASNLGGNQYFCDLGVNGLRMQHLGTFYYGHGATVGTYWDSGIAPAPNTDYHVAITRSGATFRFWINGVLRGTQTVAGTLGSSNLTINDFSGTGSPFLGTTKGFRLTSACRYTSNFTPPTAPFAVH